MLSGNLSQFPEFLFLRRLENQRISAWRSGCAEVARSIIIRRPIRWEGDKPKPWNGWTSCVRCRLVLRIVMKHSCASPVASVNENFIHFRPDFLVSCRAEIIGQHTVISCACLSFLYVPSGTVCSIFCSVYFPVQFKYFFVSINSFIISIKL